VPDVNCTLSDPLAGRCGYGRRALMPASLDLRQLGRGQQLTLGVAVVLTLVAGLITALGAAPVARFVVAGLALAALAALIGQTIEQVGARLGPSRTALLQSTLGNLPELFVGLFALSDGLTNVVQAALAGSILANTALVLGSAFIAGGLRHGTQRFDPEEPRLNASLLLLVVTALLVPTLSDQLDTPAAAHTSALSTACAVVLLLVYAASVPFYLRHRTSGAAGPAAAGADQLARSAWPLALSVSLLVVAGAGAALAADWFVGPLQSAVVSLGLSETFTGLVIVAIASNAVENAAGIRFALKAQPEYVISLTLNSPLQVALLLTPVLVLLSRVVGPAQLTLVFPPLLVAALAASAVVVALIIYDGEYTWIEGVALVALYIIMVAAFWWG
jgi:Ca2+:H+ antiporter